MALSNKLVSKFVKATKNTTNNKKDLDIVFEDNMLLWKENKY